MEPIDRSNSDMIHPALSTVRYEVEMMPVLLCYKQLGELVLSVDVCR